MEGFVVVEGYFSSHVIHCSTVVYVQLTFAGTAYVQVIRTH